MLNCNVVYTRGGGTINRYHECCLFTGNRATGKEKKTPKQSQAREVISGSRNIKTDTNQTPQSRANTTLTSPSF